jgi:hypothetical protein
MQPNDSRNAFRDAVAGSRRARFRKAEEPPVSAALVFVPGQPVHFECSDELDAQDVLFAFRETIEKLLT